MSGRIRTLKPEFLQDTVLAKLPAGARLLFVGCILLADDHGGFRADTRFLASSVFWGHSGEARKVKQWVGDLCAGKLITLYQVRGQIYGQINGWHKHQKVDRASAPRIPRLQEAESLLGSDGRWMGQTRPEQALVGPNQSMGSYDPEGDQTAVNVAPVFTQRTTKTKQVVRRVSEDVRVAEFKQTIPEQCDREIERSGSLVTRLQDKTQATADHDSRALASDSRKLANVRDSLALDLDLDLDLERERERVKPPSTPTPKVDKNGANTKAILDSIVAMPHLAKAASVKLAESLVGLQMARGIRPDELQRALQDCEADIAASEASGASWGVSAIAERISRFVRNADRFRGREQRGAVQPKTLKPRTDDIDWQSMPWITGATVQPKNALADCVPYSGPSKWEPSKRSVEEPSSLDVPDVVGAK